ncbi:wax ester/triacylglycerol synthase family O-acyltransferase [Haloechinothrix sp. YIM 98757]|uniref:Diacylglycerol O-acyltransferase n=1 Tax=Haloechinothrix aidingensis TaxID=2752311 RepID=A0A837ZWP2_9PSEU|nr:wax ester/triacylglycerol synthase family O-acyltransferase [Haloechinothrix aidingensis]
MVDRLSGLDMSFLCLDGAERPMHMGAVLIFEPEEPTSAARVARTLAHRAARVPQLARTARDTWLPFAGKVWAARPNRDVAGHVHTHALSEPGAPEQLERTVSALMAQPLEQGRPPWELHVLDGLSGGRFAVVIKMHHALADAAGAISVVGSLLDGAEPCETPADAGQRTLIDELLSWPAGARRAGGQLAADLAGGAPRLRERAQRLAGVAAATATAARPRSLASPVTTLFGESPRREWTCVRLDGAELSRVRKYTGGTLHDVVLSVIAGGVGRWVREHKAGSAFYAEANPRAFIPVSMRRRRSAEGQVGNQLSGYLCELPADATDPVERVHRVQEAMRRNKEHGPDSGAGAFPLLADAVPAGAHRLATRMLGRASPLLFDTMVSTVPLPNTPMRLDGAELGTVQPVAPLALGQALSIAVAVHRGDVQIGLLADPRVLPGVDGLRDDVAKAGAELRNAASAAEG